MCGLFLRKLFLLLLIFSGLIQAVSDLHSSSCDSSLNKILELKKFESRDDFDQLPSVDLLKYLPTGPDFSYEINRVLVSILPHYEFQTLFSRNFVVTYSGRAPPRV